MTAPSKFFFREIQSEDSEIPKSFFKKEEIQEFGKRYKNLVDSAIEKKDYVSISNLFGTHPFYEKLDIQKNTPCIVASYRIFLPESNTWEDFHVAVTGNESDLYNAIGKNIEKLSQKGKKPPQKSYADQFFDE